MTDFQSWSLEKLKAAAQGTSPSIVQTSANYFQIGADTMSSTQDEYMSTVNSLQSAWQGKAAQSAITSAQQSYAKMEVQRVVSTQSQSSSTSYASNVDAYKQDAASVENVDTSFGHAVKSGWWGGGAGVAVAAYKQQQKYNQHRDKAAQIVHNMDEDGRIHAEQMKATTWPEGSTAISPPDRNLPAPPSSSGPSGGGSGGYNPQGGGGTPAYTTSMIGPSASTFHGTSNGGPKKNNGGKNNGHGGKNNGPGGTNNGPGGTNTGTNGGTGGTNTGTNGGTGATTGSTTTQGGLGGGPGAGAGSGVGGNGGEQLPSGGSGSGGPGALGGAAAAGGLLGGAGALGGLAGRGGLAGGSGIRGGSALGDEGGRGGTRGGSGLGDEGGRGGARGGSGLGENGRGGSGLGENGGRTTGRGSALGEENGLRSGARGVPPEENLARGMRPGGFAGEPVAEAGRGGYPLAPGGGRRGGNDDEEAPVPDYLVETDDIWGDGSAAAPAVIGE